MKNKILKLAFIIWVVLWASFILRELFRKGYFYDYKELWARTLDGKRSYVTGDTLYEFLTFCNGKLPAGASYAWVGLEEGSHPKRRATYYLYPNLEKYNAEFILVFNEPNVAVPGYKIFAKLDESRYILVKKGT